MSPSRKLHTVRAAIVVLGLTAALVGATTQGALAKTKTDDSGGSESATSTAAAAPATARPIPASTDPAPGPTTCDTTATPPAPGLHKGVIIAGGAGTNQPACGTEEAGAPPATATPPTPPDHGTGATGTPPTSDAPPPPPSAGNGDTAAPPAPGTEPQAPTTGDAAAPPSGPVIHKGVVLPPSTEAAKPAAAAPTAALSSIADATVIRSRSVSTVVTVPAGLPVTDPTEISILFGFSGSSRMTQTYDPAAGNRFVFNFDAGDGTARTEDVAVSLLDRAVEGAHYGFVAKVPVEALYDATLSPLTFQLTNDCDFDFAGLIAQDSEPVIHWDDDRGQEATGELSMRAFNSVTINKFARTLTAISLKDNIEAPVVWWDEIDDVPEIPSGFMSRPVAGPLLPAATYTVSYSSHADTDEACNANIHYTETVNLLTYSAL